MLRRRAAPMPRVFVCMRSITAPATSPAYSPRSPMSGWGLRRSCAGKRKLRRRSMPALKALLRLLAETGAEAADVVAALNELYDEQSDAGLLAQVLVDTPFPLAALYYEKRAGAKFSARRRLLLTGDMCAAAASLIEDRERTAAVAAAHMEEFSPEEQGRIALLLPRSCRELSAAPEDMRMRRRIARLSGARI